MMAIRGPRHKALHSSFRQSRSIDVPQLIHTVVGRAGADAFATIRYSERRRPAYVASLATRRTPRGPLHRSHPGNPVPAAAGSIRRTVASRGTAGRSTLGG